MIRCYLASEQWNGPDAELDETESRHLAGVLRAEIGLRIQVMDGQGHLGEAEVSSPHKKRTGLHLLSRTFVPPLQPHRILAQALVREQRMDWLIQKAVELGVHEIQPLQTDQAVVHIRPEEAEKKAARWRAIALGACKQSGNPWLPRIAPVVRFEQMMQQWRGGAACFGALQEGAEPLAAYFGRLRKEACPQVTLFIGPEGDFSSREVDALGAAEVQPVTFGPLVFRVETAALYILSALQYAWQETKGVDE
ncbi:MAG: 16S rRNA (uracil(1498)-N(3))-methyltransferase [Verrucomicrobiota bacterium]|jgi:16S rRNA (uracil1498-N3)-methyltransferase|nr:16S rRNA (uracil(1498)-N(3))-methyltransferase [Verrucomicrobiota bacterium]